jgi:hypothetical protein
LLLKPQGQFALYGYYVLTAWVLRALSPPLAQMAASEAGLSGSYRAAHQKLVAAAEEVAFNEPSSGGRGLGWGALGRDVRRAGDVVVAAGTSCVLPCGSGPTQPRSGKDWHVRDQERPSVLAARVHADVCAPTPPALALAPAPGASEQLILDQHLRRLVRFTRLSSLQRFLQQIADGYLVKYLASCVVRGCVFLWGGG